MIFIFRLFYPKSRTVKFNDGTIFLLSAIASLFINVGLIGKFVSDFLKSKGSLNPLTQDELTALKALFVFEDSTYCFKPFSNYIIHVFPILPDSSSNLWVFLLDLHARALIIGIFIFMLFKIPGAMEKKAQSIPYKRDFPNSLNIFEKLLARIVGVSLDKSISDKYEKHHEKIRFGFLSWFRDALYHPWARLTSSNRDREILLVDVLTKEGSIYSGWLTSWIPTGDDSLFAIPMEYAIRYHAKESGSDDRKITFIKNNGEMIIPMSSIETLHFWEIRKNFETTIVIRKLRDVERLKWILVLAHVFPDFFSKISIHVLLTPSDHQLFAKDLAAWLEDSKIEIENDMVEIIADNLNPQKSV